MANTAQDFQQNLISQTDINSATPFATREFQEDYFRFKSDLLRTSNVGDDIESRVTSLELRMTLVEDRVTVLEVRVDAVELLAIENKARLDALEPRVSQNETDIATNASDIAEINDGRYEPKFGVGSPEGVVTSNLNRQYFDTSVPSMWVNPASGVDTGWVQVV